MTVTLMACATTLSAQESQNKPSFADHLTQARSHFSVDATGLHGPGAATIAEAVTKARYVMIGEDHLSREIPMFARGLCRLMAPDGLRAFAVETGPEAARIVNANLRRPDRIARLVIARSAMKLLRIAPTNVQGFSFVTLEKQPWRPPRSIAAVSPSHERVGRWGRAARSGMTTAARGGRLAP